MPGPDDLLRIRILDRDGTVLGWLRPRYRTPAWNLGDEAEAGVWVRREAAAIHTEYQQCQAWRGKRPELVPAAPATEPAHTRRMAALVSADGVWRVEPIMLDQGNGPRLRYRITRWGVHVATVARVEDIGRHVDLADLSEEPARGVGQPPSA